MLKPSMSDRDSKAQISNRSASVELVAGRDDVCGARTALSARWSSASRTWLSALLGSRLRRAVSVSIQIVAGRDDFAERGCVRSTSRSASGPREVSVSPQPFVPFPPAAAGPADTAAVLRLRLRAAVALSIQLVSGRGAL